MPIKRLDSLRQGCRIDMLLGLGIELSQLLPETLLALGHLLSFALKPLTLNDLRQVQIEQPSLLAFELRQDITQRLASGLQGLGQPFAPLRPLQFTDNEGRFAQDPTEVLPDQVVQDTSRGIAGRAALTEGFA